MNWLSGLLGGVDPMQLAMQSGGMPNLSNPAGAMTQIPMQGNPLMGIDLTDGQMPMAGLDPSSLAGPYLANGNPMSTGRDGMAQGLLGLAASMPQQQRALPPMAPAGGISRAQMTPLALMPGARMLSRR